MTEEQQRKYLENGGVECPHCSSDFLSTRQGIPIVEGEIIHIVTCEDCKQQWTDHYYLVAVTPMIRKEERKNEANKNNI